MEVENPKAVEDLLAFFVRAGLTCREREEAGPNGNKLYDYRIANLIIRVVRDRGSWEVAISEIADEGKFPVTEYFAADLHYLLFGHGEDRMSFEAQAKFFENNWDAVLDLFSERKRDAARQTLKSLKDERARRVFPHRFQ